MTEELTPEQKEFMRLAFEFIDENRELLERIRDSKPRDVNRLIEGLPWEKVGE